MKIGTDEHKQRFCDAFFASHYPCEPELPPWPKLGNAALDSLRAIPFWTEVLSRARSAAGNSPE